MADGQFFTKADWRPGKHRKRRKRTKPWGGAKVAPAAFVKAGEAYRFKPGREGARICTSIKRDGTPCRMLALNGVAVCGAHGGFSVWARRGILQKSGKGEALKAMRAAAVEGRIDAAPPSLARMLAYQEADQRTKMKLIQAFGTSSWINLIMKVTKQRHGAIERCV